MAPLRITALIFVVLFAPLQVWYIHQMSARLPFDVVSIACAIVFIFLILIPFRRLSIKSSFGIGLIALVVIFGICVLHRLHDLVIVAMPLLNILALASHRLPRVEHNAVLFGLSFSIAIAAYALGTVPSLAIQLMAGDLQNIHQFIWSLFGGYHVDLSVAAVAVLPFVGTTLALKQSPQTNSSSS